MSTSVAILLELTVTPNLPTILGMILDRAVRMCQRSPMSGRLAALLGQAARFSGLAEVRPNAIGLELGRTLRASKAG